MTDDVNAEPEWRDLAMNRPGQAARGKALELKQAAPAKAVIARLFGIKTNERAWRVGADGEVEVARRLLKLGDGWHVIHAVPVGAHDADIDHVVIGPPGVFSLNTKNHYRSKVWVAEHAFLVDGQRTDYIRNSRFEAKRASSLLSAACGFGVVVEPVLVVMSAAMTIKAMPDGVHVIGRKDIASWLARRPSLLTEDGVDQIFNKARRDSTWQPGGVSG